MRQRLTICIAVLGSGAATVAPAFGAHGPGGNGHGPGTNGHGPGQNGKAQTVTYVFKGVYQGAGEAEGIGDVTVERGNAQVKKAHLVGTDVSFDFTAAEIAVADTDLSGESDIDDVVSGDKVLVQARLSRQDPGPQPYGARKLVDQTHPPADEDEEEGL